MMLRLIRWFTLLFSLSFLYLSVHIAVGGYYKYRPVALPLCILGALGLTALLVWLAARWETRLAEYMGFVTEGLLLVMFGVRLGLGLALRYAPVFDIDAVYGGAIEWAETGSFPSYYEYYGYFFNNFGAMRLLSWAFRLIRWFGCRDYYLAATALNAGFSLATVAAAGGVGRKLAGIRGQLVVYGLFLLTPPFYFIAPAFYTDALSMPFPLLILWLYLVVRDTEERRKRLLLYGLMGLASAAGTLLRPTVLIAAAAVVLDAAFARDIRRGAAITAAAALCLWLGYGEMTAAAYRHLDRESAERSRTPALHWVMMGLQGLGTYAPEDYDFTRSFDDPAERYAALRAEISERIRALGPSGLVRLLTGKGDICFGDGTLGLGDCLGGEPLRPSVLRELLLEGGRYYDAYKHICAGVLLALYGLMIAAGLRDALGEGGSRMLAVRLAVFGLLVFLCCWEARWRYYSSYVPVIFLGALPEALGLPGRFGRIARRLWAG